jgi:hypothetical protein
MLGVRRVMAISRKLYPGSNARLNRFFRAWRKEIWAIKTTRFGAQLVREMPQPLLRERGLAASRAEQGRWKLRGAMSLRVGEQRPDMRLAGRAPRFGSRPIQTHGAEGDEG